MANLDAPSGLTPVGHLLGLNWIARGKVYYIAASDGVAYAAGDPVTLNGTGSALGVPGVVLASAGTGNVITGVFMGAGTVEGGPYLDPSNLNTTVIASTHTSGYYAYVIDDPYVIFQAQESDDSTALAATDIGNNANWILGTNNGYVSGGEIAETGVTTTATLQLKLLGLARIPNNVFGHYAKWLVLINNHSYKAGVAGL